MRNLCGDFIWHSSGGCEKCTALDGKEFDTLGEIPERPHPNCKCEIERVKINEPTSSGQEDKKEERFVARDKFIEALLLLKKAKGTPTGYGAPTNAGIRAKIIKHGLDTGIPVYGKWHNEPIAKEFWKMASEDFKKSQDFINRNGKIYKNTRELVRSENLQRYEDKIRAKVHSQFNTSDIYGVYFRENSEVARAIENSPEFKKYINDNKNNIIRNGSIKEKSLQFWANQSRDLYHAFGKVEILESRIGTNGRYIETYIIDTYDFNKNEGPLVQAGRTVQEAGMLTPYYTVTKIITPVYK